MEIIERMYEDISKLFRIFGGNSSIIRFEILNCLNEEKNIAMSPAVIVNKITNKIENMKLKNAILLNKSNKITTSNIYHHIKSLIDLQFITIVEKDSSLKIKKYQITNNGEIFLDFITEFYSNTSSFKEIGIYFTDELFFNSIDNTMLDDIEKNLTIKKYEKTPFIDYGFQEKTLKLKKRKNYEDFQKHIINSLIIKKKENILNIIFEIKFPVPTQKNNVETNKLIDDLCKNHSLVLLFAYCFLEMVSDLKEAVIDVTIQKYKMISSKDSYSLWFKKNKILESLDQKIVDITSKPLQEYLELDRVYMK